MALRVQVRAGFLLAEIVEQAFCDSLTCLPVLNAKNRCVFCSGQYGTFVLQSEWSSRRVERLADIDVCGVHRLRGSVLPHCVLNELNYVS